MPYNNTPIAPTPEVTGQVSLPLARVKKIIQTDSDIAQCSNNAAFIITVAAEMFLQHLVEQSYNIVKSERTSKPRRNIQYRDVANAVARVENLEFLTDVVPRTMTFKQYKARVAGDKLAAEKNRGKGTLDAHVQALTDGEEMGREESNGTSAATAMEIDDEEQDKEEEEDEDDEVVLAGKSGVEAM